MADITVIGGLIFAGLLELPVPAECAALQAWYARQQQRPQVRMGDDVSTGRASV